MIFDQRGNLLLSNQAFADFYPLEVEPTPTLEQLGSRLVVKDDAPLLPAGPGLEGEAYLNHELYAVRIVPLPPTTLSPGGGTIVTLMSLRARVERDRARAEALGFITHELRTPLVAIQGFAQVLMRYPDSPDSAAAPETIFRESKRLLALINTYLDVLRLDAGARPVDTSIVELDETVRQVFDILQPIAATSKMRLVFESREPAWIRGDAPLLSGAVLNLVSNAIKYGRLGSEIRVRCFHDRDQVVLTVHNAGEPISPGDLPRVFDPYFRASKVEAARAGWGLGLAFVKRIAEKHGGSVGVESNSNGTTFEIRLPANTAAAAA